MVFTQKNKYNVLETKYEELDDKVYHLKEREKLVKKKADMQIKKENQKFELVLQEMRKERQKFSDLQSNPYFSHQIPMERRQEDFYKRTQEMEKKIKQLTEQNIIFLSESNKHKDEKEAIDKK